MLFNFGEMTMKNTKVDFNLLLEFVDKRKLFITDLAGDNIEMITPFLDNHFDYFEIKRICEDSVICGYDDWRLPTTEELKRILEKREMIFGDSARYLLSSRFWSNEVLFDNRNYVKIIMCDNIGRVNDGYTMYCDKCVQTLYVR